MKKIATQILMLWNSITLKMKQAEFIRQKLPQGERLIKLNEIAIIQMRSLLGNPGLKKLK